ncbi:hypothetical protein ACFL1R_00125 [Candidatus Latescibacterota bacterium]
MLRKLLLFMTFCMFLILIVTQVSAQGLTTGAHVKLTLFDYKDGKMNGIKGHESAGMAFTETIIYISSEISDRISVELQPMFNAKTGATPRFGTDLGNTKGSNISPKFDEFRRAVFTVMMPYDIEMSIGILKPQFTWDYGAELFWEEETNGGKFSINNFLGAMHETGIELYKPLELPFLSLPTYIYLLNGGKGGQKNLYNDNNNSPTAMIHVEPEIGAFRFQGSLARGKWDDDGKYNMTRYSAGAGYVWGNFAARAEVAGGNWENSIAASTLEDATPFGYYAKLLWDFSWWGKAMLHYDYALHNFNGFITTNPGEEEYVTISPGLIINIASGSMIQIQYDIADWRQWGASGDETLKFNRLTAGWRSTF